MFLNKISFMVVALIAFLVMGNCSKKTSASKSKDAKTANPCANKPKASTRKKVNVIISKGMEASRYKTQKVVYHFNVNNFKKTNSGLRNIKNHYNALKTELGEKLDAIAVFHGGGVFTLMKNPKNEADKNLAEKIQAWIVILQQRGLKIDICANTLKGKKIDYKKELHPEIDAFIVPSGVAELSYLQDQGYTYIRP